MEISIRPFQDNDREQVVRMWSTVFKDDPPWNEPGLVIDRKLKVQPELFLVSTQGETVTGTVIAGYDGFRGWVHHVVVDPAAQRQGIASKLMSAAESALREIGCPKLNLQVRDTNKKVIAFYTSLGYNVEPRASLGKLL